MVGSSLVAGIFYSLKRIRLGRIHSSGVFCETNLELFLFRQKLNSEQ